MAILVPHFDLPFRLLGRGFATVEQDSYEDVANCVEAIIRTPYGTRDDSPEFGIDDLTFDIRPLNIEALTAQIENEEPRTTLAVREDPNLIDNLVSKIVIEVQ